MKSFIAIHVILITLFLPFSSSMADRNHEDLEMAVPYIDSIESSRAFYERANAKVPCAVKIAAYYSCLDEHPKYNLGNDCHSAKTIVKQCFDKLERRKTKLCNNLQRQYRSALQGGNADTADYILNSTPELSYSKFVCNWQKNERIRVEKQKKCQSKYQEFNKKLDRNDISFAEKILYENKECDWAKEGFSKIQSKKNQTDGYASSSNQRPSYSKEKTTIKRWKNGKIKSEVTYYNNGKKKQEKQFNSKGILISEQYFYKNGRKKKTKIYWSNGLKRLGLAKVIDYPANGGKPKAVCYNQDGSRRNHLCSP